MVALKMNGSPLIAAAGVPRVAVHAAPLPLEEREWLNEIEFISEYRDGYWEMYGYHERGNVADEERFKGDGYKPVPRRAFGTA